MEPIIDLIIADDHSVYREGLIAALQGCDDIRIVDAVENGEELLQSCILHEPDVVLTDIMMPETDGMEAAKQILSILPDTRIVALTMVERSADIFEMLHIGAYGYVFKNSKKELISEAVRSAFQRKTFFCEGARAKCTVYINAEMNSVQVRSLFNDKELQIIEGICKEKTSKQIGDKLFLAKRTVDWHRENIMKKMGVRSNIGVAVYAIKNGLHKI